MRKYLIGAMTPIVFFFIVILSYADMNITYSGMTSSNGSIHQSGSFSNGDDGYDPEDAVISGTNNYLSSAHPSFGGYFKATGQKGMAVYGFASNSGDIANYGGHFVANGTSGSGVLGTGFGNDSYGVIGRSFGANGVGVLGVSYGLNGKGFYGLVTGNSTKGIAVHGKVQNSGSAKNYGGYFEADGFQGQGVYSEATGENSIGVYGKATGANSTGVYGSGVNYNFYANGPGADYGTFTGAHDVKFADTMPQNILPGMIVSVTGQTLKKTEKNGKTSLSSTLPEITLSNKVNDKAVFGIILFQSPLPEGHWYEAEENERFGVVNALGEGCVWVTDINGKIEAGDYITTSSVPGYGQLQNDDFLHSYTLGKAIETINFDQEGEEISFERKTYKAYLLAVVYTSG